QLRVQLAHQRGVAAQEADPGLHCLCTQHLTRQGFSGKVVDISSISITEEIAMSTIETIASQLVPVGTWKADPVHSQIEFGIKHLGIVTVKGRFGDFDATLEGGDEARLVGTIRTASVDTYDGDRDAHLRSPEFFDTERYPEAR